MSLNIPKCVLIPLNPSLSHIFIHEWLCQYTPSFSNMSIDTFGEYLGILLGPSVEEQFNKVIAKYFSNCRKFGSSAVAPALIILLYNSKAFSLFSYVLQVLLPSSYVLMAERRMIHSIYKLPFNTHTSTSIFEIAALGLPAPHSMIATSAASRYRLSLSLNDDLMFLQSHRKSFTEQLPVIGLSGWIPKGWHSSSLLSNLMDQPSIAINNP